MIKRIEIAMTDEEFAFVKWMAKKDSKDYDRKVTLKEEMQMIFSSEINNLMMIYGDQFEEETR